MKNRITKILLFSTLAIIMGLTTRGLMANAPATPQRLSSHIELDGTPPVTGDVTLKWVDGDINNPLGDVFRVTQYTEVNGAINKEVVGRVKRDDTKEYEFEIEELPTGAYCYTVDLYSTNLDIASSLSNRVCVKIGENNSDRGMLFNLKSRFISLGDDGVGDFFVGVRNNTDCEFDVKVIKSEIKVEVVKRDDNGVGLLIKAQERGLYKVLLGLVNKCNDKIVDKAELTVCYGKCNIDEQSIHFERRTQFQHKLVAGTPWHYDIDAISDDDCKLNYLLVTNGIVNVPDGLKLDKETGVLSWDNPIEGQYKALVSVVSLCDSGKTHITGVFYLYVAGKQPDFSSVLHCNFKDSENDTINEFHGRVILWSAEKPLPNLPPNIRHRVFTQELNGSSVDFKIPAGKYYLKADVKGYVGQYYEEARILSEATIIEVGENDTVRIKMALHPIPKPEMFKVSGQVVSATTGEPLPAVVTFVPAKWLSGVRGGIDPNFNAHFKVKTDIDGKYTIELPNNFEYYALAEAKVNSNTTIYKLQWYEGAETFYDADIIKLTQNIDNINFKLEEYKVEKGHIDGQVVDENGNALQSIVIALSLDVNYRSNFKYIVRTNEKGYFVFDNLKYGNYILLSIPTSWNYIPGYFVMGDFTTLEWREATKIGVGDFAPTINYQIKHKLLAKGQAKGIARIIGKILKGLRGITPGGTSEGTPVSGSIVSLTNENGELTNYFVTDSEGNFELEGVAPGTYTLRVDKVGYEEYTEQITVDYGNSLEVETEVILNQTLASVDYDNFESANLNISPMPVSGVSVITFEATLGNADIRLVDMTGNVVYSTSIATSSGTNQFNLDSKDIPAGAYIIVIQNGTKSIAGGITIIK